MPFESIENKTVVVTGCNTGIGKETAKQLAKQGARVIMACRNQVKAEEARNQIIAETGNQNVVFMKLDLACFESVKAFADQYNKNESRLDILVNNAGLIKMERTLTEDGHETMFGTNHLGLFLLTNLLLDKIKSSAPSRIVVVSSLAHKGNPIDFDDLQAERSYSTMKTYGRSKTANVLFAVHLAKLLQGTGVTVYSLHPGGISTEFAREMPYHNTFFEGCILCCFMCCFACEKPKSIEEGAQTTLYCCLEASIANQSGEYYQDCKKSSAKAHATDPAHAQRLWDISADICGVSGSAK